MSELRDQIAKAISEIPTVDETEPADDGPGDEIVAAIERQLDVLEGTAVVLGNVVQMLGIQISNLRAEVGLFSQPAQESEPAQPEVRRTPSGASVEASLPVEKRLPDFCLHEDALVVQTTEGPQRVCPDCEAEADG